MPSLTATSVLCSGFSTPLTGSAAADVGATGAGPATAGSSAPPVAAVAGDGGTAAAVGAGAEAGLAAVAVAAAGWAAAGGGEAVAVAGAATASESSLLVLGKQARKSSQQFPSLTQLSSHRHGPAELPHPSSAHRGLPG